MLVKDPNRFLINFLNNIGPVSLTDINGMLYFISPVTYRSNVWGLWRSYGTKIGTCLIKTFTYLSDPINLNGTLFLAGDDGVHGLELWKVANPWSLPVMVKDINPNGSADPRQLTNVNGTLYFLAYLGLWKSDGTEAGTMLVKSLIADNLINVNGTLFFAADDGVHGWELWKSDGTAAGTVMVKDINKNGSSLLGAFAAINGKLYFSASDGVHGTEPWVSDGTEAGTAMVADINPDGSSYPSGFIRVENTVCFTAYDGSHGWELWKTTPVK